MLECVSCLLECLSCLCWSVCLVMNVCHVMNACRVCAGVSVREANPFDIISASLVPKFRLKTNGEVRCDRNGLVSLGTASIATECAAMVLKHSTCKKDVFQVGIRDSRKSVVSEPYWVV